jgi:hypothetical protein
MRTQMGMDGSHDLSRGNTANKFQWSDFATLIVAHYCHWHQCMIQDDLSKLVDNFNKSFDPFQKQLSTALSDCIIWPDIRGLLGLS